MGEARAVLLDVDGVLVDTTALFAGVWRRWAAARSLDPVLVAGRTSGRRVRDVLAEVAPHLDAAAESAVLDELTAAELGRVRPIPGAADLLRRLDGVPWAIVSSGSKWCVEACLHAAALPLPAVRVFAEDVRLGKPSPEGYLTAARRLGVPAADCVVVEDSPAGVRAGGAAGCTVVAVATTHSLRELQAADVRVPTLAAASRRLAGAVGPLTVTAPLRARTHGGHR
ncbi:HAD-IA family hydrolase [Actinoallomurus soli]|uniref:HAD-IA family hydrolase n=1 Tax=Actinoallomurus soli TaxID=2952535 RepID=UPI0020931C30|nr:HAD-IA family hydrolase [Actinoallomurus soli]MCO5972484.1 HAD-IA family hydrolase [Actinoallomurus soli]